MALFLVAFHEQAGIMPSDMLGQYDRALAAVGIVFSFVPLAMYIWRELQYSTIWTRLRRANSYIGKGDFNAALKEANAALDLSFDAGVARRFALPWSMKGDALYALKEHAKAKAQYDISLGIDPDDDMTWCQVGNIQAFDAKRAVALNSYEKALKINPDNAYAWNNKGVIYVSLAWPEEAMVCFNKAMLLMPKNFDAHINLAKITSRLERHDESVMHYRHALDLRPNSEVAQLGLRREFLRGQRIDQIKGWEQLGLDTRYMWRMLKEDPADFDKHTKEFLSSIVEQRTQLTIGTGREKIDVNAAIETILRVTDRSGATMEQIERGTGLTREQMVLPMALLMKTDRLHFTRFGEKDIYVSKGKAPDEPAPVPVKEEPPAEEPATEVEDGTEVAEEPAADEAEESPARRKRFARDKSDDLDLEPTASVLVFGKRKAKESPKPQKKRPKKSKKKS
jgi:tetratricopeptide (TPR) repeat protein